LRRKNIADTGEEHYISYSGRLVAFERHDTGWKACQADNMETQLPFTILPQPTETTCGPTCLHAIYGYYKDKLSIDKVIRETRSLKEGGTLAVFLGCHALQRGYHAILFTYNLQMFDPTWFETPGIDIRTRLERQAKYRTDPKVQLATEGYLEFIDRGGSLRLKDLNPALIRKYLNRGVPILAGLSATYLHRSAREQGHDCEYDDVRGSPTGHFVVLYGYNRPAKSVLVAEPLHPNPVAVSQYYSIRIDRVICSILLGVLTYDANLLIIENSEGENGKSDSR